MVAQHEVLAGAAESACADIRLIEGHPAGQALPDEAMNLRVAEQRQGRRLQGQSIAGEHEEPLLLRADQVGNQLSSMRCMTKRSCSLTSSEPQ